MKRRVSPTRPTLPPRFRTILSHTGKAAKFTNCPLAREASIGVGSSVAGLCPSAPPLWPRSFPSDPGPRVSG